MFDGDPWRRLHEELGQHTAEVPWFQLVGLQLGELERPRDASLTERRLALLRRVTLALLPFEIALATGWWLAWRAPSPSIFEQCLADAARNLGTGALLGVILVQILRRRGRLPEPRWSFIADLLAGAGWVGLLITLGGGAGLAIVYGPVDRLGRVLAVGAGVGLVLVLFRVKLRVAFPPLPGTTKGDDRFALILFAVFLVLASVGLFLMNGESVEPAARAVAVAVAAVPALGVLRLLGLARSVVYPCSIAQIRSRQIPPTVRLRLAVLGASAVLPCGGVVVPAWSLLRRSLWAVAPAIKNEEEIPRGGGAISSVE